MSDTFSGRGIRFLLVVLVLAASVETGVEAKADTDKAVADDEPNGLDNGERVVGMMCLVDPRCILRFGTAKASTRIPDAIRRIEKVVVARK